MKGMLNGLVAAVLAVWPVMAAEGDGEWRTWASTAGTKIEARMVEREGGTVVLERKEGGKRLTVKLSQLSVADREFVAAIPEEPKEKGETSVADLEAKSGEALVSSKWGEIGKGLSMRIHSPREFTATSRHRGARGKIDYYVKCEIRNDGSKNSVLTPRGHLSFKDESGKTNLVPSYSAGWFPEQTLAPGDSVVWWQNGAFDEGGAYSISVQLADGDGDRSPALPVKIIRSKTDPKDKADIRKAGLQKQIGKLLEFLPNTDEDKVSFRKFQFSGDPIIIDGRLYSAFRFTVPATDKSGALQWAFNLGPPKINGCAWGILAAKGSTFGFRHFHKYTLDHDLATVGEEGDLIILQGLGEDLIPEKEFIIWFENRYRDLPDLTVSFNMLNDGEEFEMIKKNATRQ